MFKTCLLLVLLLVCRPASALSGDRLTAAYIIAGSVLVVYLVADLILFLIVVYVCCCRTGRSRVSSKPVRNKVQALQYKHRSGSYEFVDGGEVLDLKSRRRSSGENVYIEVECAFDDQKKQEMMEEKPELFKETLSMMENENKNEDHDEDENENEDEKKEVFNETHFSTPEKKISRLLNFEERKKHLTPNRSSAVRKNSETFLLSAEEQNDSDDDEEEKGSLPGGGVSPIDTSLPEILDIPEISTKHERSESPDSHLVSLASTVGAVIPEDVPPGEVPRDMQSLDLSTIHETTRKDSSMLQETSFLSDSFHIKTGSDLDGSLSNGYGGGSFNRGTSPVPNDINVSRTSIEGSGLHNTTSRSSVEGSGLLNTISGTSLGYSEVEATVRSVALDVDVLLGGKSEEPKPQNTAFLQQGFMTPQANRPFVNSTPSGKVISPFLQSLQLDISRQSTNDGVHQRSHSYTQANSYATPPQSQTSDPDLRDREWRLLSSQSASTTPKHNYNNVYN